MLQEIGYNFIWAFFMSLTIYAGSGQYLGGDPAGAAASLGTVAVMTLLINFRHLVYGLSMLEKFRGMGPRKLYMIFSLTDETMPCCPRPGPGGGGPPEFLFCHRPAGPELLDSGLGHRRGGRGADPLQHRGGGLRHDRPVRGHRLGPVEELPEAPARRSGGRGDGAVSDCPGPLLRQDQMLLISLGAIVLCLLVLRDRLDEKEEETC